MCCDFSDPNPNGLGFFIRKNKLERTFFMKAKKFTTKLLAVLSAAAIAVGATAMSAFAADKQSVKSELSSVAGLLADTNNSANYTNDFVYAMLVAGKTDDSFNESYKASVVEDLAKNDGKLTYTDTYSGVTSESLLYEATAAIVLNAMGYDVRDIGGYDLEAIISKVDLTQVSNPYHLCEALKAATKIGADSALCEKLLAAIMACYSDSTAIENAGGMDYWGLSVDNNGMFIEAVAPYMSANDDVKQAVEKSFNYIAAMKTADGYDYSDSYPAGSGNADSTSLALRAFVAVGDAEKAEEAYNFLLGFKSQNVNGAYLYGGEESLYAAKDAANAIAAYYTYLPNEEPATEVTSEEVTNAATQEVTTTASVTETKSTTTTAASTKKSSNSTDKNANTGAGKAFGVSVFMAAAVVGFTALKRKEK